MIQHEHSRSPFGPFFGSCAHVGPLHVTARMSAQQQYLASGPNQPVRGSRRRRQPAPMLTHNPHKMLACPFNKLDKTTYRPCRSLVLRQTSDLRTHLRRYHLQPPFCPICKDTFLDDRRQDKLNEHIRQRNCQPNDKPDPPGIGLDLWDQLTNQRSRERDTPTIARVTTAEERRWFTMWDLLFPGQPRPQSAYHEVSEFREHVADARKAFFDEGTPRQRINDLFTSQSYQLNMWQSLESCVSQIFDEFEQSLDRHGDDSATTGTQLNGANTDEAPHDTVDSYNPVLLPPELPRSDTPTSSGWDSFLQSPPPQEQEQYSNMAGVANVGYVYYRQAE
ncbi:hypothetical protein QBC35DRAFT_504599 [Podospora australis]|uniref:C2H2-type domain-containing protein n=1 Tax=Podospora australis TaxID=1536484 RepID=A0AAN6WND3_9PEZI|nr:hypothetical protein QBC35DRAFT_504599 [Podospora australis]